MDSERTGSDDLDVNLQWPNEPEAGGPIGTPLRATPNEPAESEQVRAYLAENQVTINREPIDDRLALEPMPGLGGASHAPLASIAIRLEALTAATTMMRVALSDRLSDVADQVARAVGSTARDIADYRNLGDRAQADIRDRMAEIESTLSRLSTESSRLQLALQEQRNAALDQAQDQKEWIAARLQEWSGRDDSGLQALEEVTRRLAATHAEDVERILAAFKDATAQQGAGHQTGLRLMSESAERIEEAAQRLQDTHSGDLERIADGITRLADWLEQLDRRLDAVEASIESSMAPASGDQVDVLSRLDALTTQFESLRRRIALRARSEPMLDVAALDSLAESIAERLQERPPEPDSPPRRRRSPRP